ncbi:MAG: Rne/Rng family ribonuclease [Alphaproteobacteria bacterium]|nr:Rne/Rng family ribonuclease [Alphaproteobacteria bacterium]
MDKELIVNCTKNKVELALLENKKLVRFETQTEGDSFQTGDFYFGKVKKIMPSLNAVFVEIGHEKTAFLHYSDLSPAIKNILKFCKHYSQPKADIIDLKSFQTPMEVEKTGKISQVLANKPSILVQISKEPFFNKGPRVTCEFSIPGRFIVLTPFSETISISKKIVIKEEKLRLQKIINEHKPPYFGIIVRTAAEGKSDLEVIQDLKNCLEIWKTIEKNVSKFPAPAKLYSESNKAVTILRELLSPDFTKIVVNENNLYQTILHYIQQIAPDKIDIVSMYTQKTSIFDTYQINKQLKQLFNKKVYLNSGAYLILEATEALFVIDVNSGNNQQNKNQEDNAFQTNMEACEEIARQLKLRDIGGIIVIDFIDMKLPDHRKSVTDSLTDLMKTDKARIKISTISKFGLLQLTRERTKPAIEVDKNDWCWACEGTGKITVSKNLDEELDRVLNILSQNGTKQVSIEVHPIVATYLKSGFLKTPLKTLSKKHQIKIDLKNNDQLNLININFYNEFGDKFNDAAPHL